MKIDQTKVQDLCGKIILYAEEENIIDINDEGLQILCRM